MSTATTQSSSFASLSESQTYPSTTSRQSTGSRPEELERALSLAFTQTKLDASMGLITSQCGIFTLVLLAIGVLLFLAVHLLVNLLDDGTRKLGPYLPFVDFRVNLRDALVAQQLERHPTMDSEGAEAWMDWYLSRPLTISRSPPYYFDNNIYDIYRCPSMPQELVDSRGDQRSRFANATFFFTRSDLNTYSFLCYNHTLRITSVTVNEENTLHADLDDGICTTMTGTYVCPRVRDLLFGLEVPGFYENGSYPEFACLEDGGCYIETTYDPLDLTLDTVLELRVEFEVPAYDYSSCERLYLGRPYDYSKAIRRPKEEGGEPEVDYWILGRRMMSTNFCKSTAIHEIHRTVPLYYFQASLIYLLGTAAVLAPLIVYWVVIRKRHVATVTTVIRRRARAHWHYLHRHRTADRRGSILGAPSQNVSPRRFRSTFEST